MTKYETLEKKYIKAQAGKAGIKADIDKLTAQRDKLEAEAQTKAEAGDTAGYMESKTAADKVTAELYVKEEFLKKADHPIDMDEAQDAWREYRKKADKELQAAWQKYIKERAKLADSFRDVMKIQDETKRIREQCALFVGTDKADAINKERDFNCYLLKHFDVMHDTLFFSRLKLFSLDEQIHYNIKTVDYR